MELHICAICSQTIDSGSVVFAEVIDNKPTAFAHEQCWADSGRETLSVRVYPEGGGAPQDAG